MLSILLIISTGSLISCGQAANDKNSDERYKLIHSADDAEYIISWDYIVSQCPDIGTYDKQEFFIHRGDSKQSNARGISVIEMDSPVAWSSIRSIMTGMKGEGSRSFIINVTYYDTAAYLDEQIELMAIQGIPFEMEGDFTIAVMKSSLSTKYVQLHLAGHQFYVQFITTASADGTLFFSRAKLMELLSGIKDRISSLEITPLPAEIPDRELKETQDLQNTLREVKN